MLTRYVPWQSRRGDPQIMHSAVLAALMTVAIFTFVCLCVFGIIRSEGGRASCQLSVDGRNIIKIIMFLLCMICPTPCMVPHLINVHMHVL